MSSTTITLSGNDSTLTAYYQSPIELEPEYKYELGLIDFQTYNSIHNVDKTNNRFHIKLISDDIAKFSSRSSRSSASDGTRSSVIDSASDLNKIIFIPKGAYEIEDLSTYLKKTLKYRKLIQIRTLYIRID